MLAIQNVRLTSKNASLTEDIMIPDHTLYGEYPPKVPEEEIKPVNEPGEIVLSRVVVPEIIVVHDGIPSDSSAQNYYVNYRDYIKNVASSEIYATWPTATIEANVLAFIFLPQPSYRYPPDSICHSAASSLPYKLLFRGTPVCDRNRFLPPAEPASRVPSLLSLDP